MSLKYSTKFTVEGHGPFPLDMLRYDGCFPAGPGDVGSMIEPRPHPAAPSSMEVRRVTLLTFHGTKAQNGVTAGRWKSFGWKVIEVRDPYKLR
jgi:hypothetical protein